MTGQRMLGGRTSGATRRGDTVVRPGGPWNTAVHAVLRHLEAVGFQGAPRVVGHDENGDQILTYLEGRTVGVAVPWPDWVRSEEALVQVGKWLRGLHDATARFHPPPGLTWFAGQQWRPGLVIGHHDAAPYNAVWNDDGLVGFVDWDTAGPSSADLDLAFTALWWVPLLPHHVVEPLGFTDARLRSRRLHLLLDAYGYTRDRAAFGATIARRARLNAAVIHQLAGNGEPVYQAMLPAAAQLEEAALGVDSLPTTFWQLEPPR